jgi:hypothetical protein
LNKRTIYIVYNFFKDIYEQPERLSAVSLHKTQDVTAKTCGIQRSIVQKICNEAFISSSDSKIFASARKTHRTKHDNVTDMNDFGKGKVYRVLVGKPEGKNHLIDHGVDGRIGLDWILWRLAGVEGI